MTRLLVRSRLNFTYTTNKSILHWRKSSTNLREIDRGSGTDAHALGVGVGGGGGGGGGGGRARDAMLYDQSCCIRTLGYGKVFAH